MEQEYNYGPAQPVVTPDEPKRKKAGFGAGLLCGLLIMALVCGAAFGVYYRITSQKRFGELTHESVANEAVNRKMEEIQSLLDNYYYLNEVTTEDLEIGIYNGMIEATGDKYADYYTYEELLDMLQSTEGVYYGIGATVQLDATGYVRIAGTIKDSPAEAAGLRENDIIYQADGQDLYGYSLEEAVALIRGEEGTSVELGIIRDGEDLSFTIVRAKVENPTVTYEMQDDAIGYIRISEFDDVTVGQFQEALSSIRSQGAKGLIIDLRSNPGGLLSAVVSIAQEILPKGLIVYTENKAGEREEYTCDGTKELDIPLVVLVNGNSASASEILSGAIKDYGIGTLVGTTTYGKGIVQQVMSLSDNTAVKITVSAYYTPNGNNIHGTGIAPDVEIEMDTDAYYDEGVDNQLEKGLEVLREKMKQ
ncbi:MAG: S41 family peptidase [Lachnospiraceae bacterium]|nr:S41 family peptidase [Lachnospiraceae bacterium]